MLTDVLFMQDDLCAFVLISDIGPISVMPYGWALNAAPRNAVFQIVFVDIHMLHEMVKLFFFIDQFQRH